MEVLSNISIGAERARYKSNNSRCGVLVVSLKSGAKVLWLSLAFWKAAFWKGEIFVIGITSTFNMNTTWYLWGTSHSDFWIREWGDFKNSPFGDVSIHCCCPNEVNVVENVLLLLSWFRSYCYCLVVWKHKWIEFSIECDFVHGCLSLSILVRRLRF